MGKLSKRRSGIDFKTIEFKDIDGGKIEIQDFYKVLANVIYRSVQSIDMLEIAMKIYKGDKVLLNRTQINEIVALMQNPQCGLVAFARLAVIQHLNGIKE